MRRLSLALVCLLGLSGCGEDEPVGAMGSTGGTAGSGGASGSGGTAGTATQGFSVRGSVEQVFVTHADADEELSLVDSSGGVVGQGKADSLGSYVFRKVPPGDGYSVRSDDSGDEVGPITVMAFDDSTPPQSFYDGQTLKAGVNYITVRDGIQLAAFITLPGPIEDGPYPTVVNYSGYNPAEPGAPLSPEVTSLCGALPILCEAPQDASALISGLNGYATVGVNMRGTGCSGGAYDFFEPLQLLDGYDVIEAVAAQSWVLHNHVGMTGLSYPGITQLFVARMKPPSLAAITPLSVIGSTHTTLVPGGILNDGFALNWADNVLSKADPYAQGWEQARVDAGDTVCEENQLLHGQKVDILQKAFDTPYYTDEVVKPLDPTDFVDQIDVPVFVACAWQDEQTGPYCFNLLDKFDNAALTRFTMYNGVHVDGFAPQVLVEWKTFLDLYVAETVPAVPEVVRTLGPILFENIFGAQLKLPPDRFANYATHAEALAAYEAEPDVRILLENGANTTPGAPEATAQLLFESWPPPATQATRWYFQPDGTLASTAPAVADSASQFDLDSAAGQRGILAPGGEIWDLLPDYDWKQSEAGKAVIMETGALPQDLVMVGSGSVDLWLTANVDDADLEVSLSELRPDGQEMFVQSGWLRASQRKLGQDATELWPTHTYREPDVALLVPGEWVEARVGLNAFAHVFRAGSKIRLIIDTPGDSRAEWRFALKEFPSTATYGIGHDATHSSSIALPVIAGQASTTPLPACPSLRGQQCRTAAPFANTPFTP